MNQKRQGTPANTDMGQPPAAPSSRTDIDAFLARARSMTQSVAQGGRGRLIFALDATMSRQPTWDVAVKLQDDMFRGAAAVGGLDIQLVYYRGLGECRASPWISDGPRLSALMQRIDCQGGQTQIQKVLSHARKETQRTKVQALVFVGDAMEESLDAICASAGELGLLGVPAFVFQEGGDPVAAQGFKEIARLTHGAYCRFDEGAARELGELLRAVAVFAAGGMKALSDLSARQNAGARKLLAQLR